MSIGLDNSGKTAILYRLKYGEFFETKPTLSFNVENVTISKKKMKIWDVGGNDKQRPLWKSYLRDCDGIVFVVDSSDELRMEEAKHELLAIGKSPGMAHVPILILANKQDIPGALSPMTVARMLSLKELTSNRPWHVQPTCARNGNGIQEGMHQLCELTRKKNRKQMAKPNRNSFTAVAL
ncbi:ADP-ribosylation factor-like protein 4A [Trichoplax sp. H2]|nr:ADP-ribosylation factor-like protein 4A [Trichoplax sp. H2]|eukprot:RDD38716.1 ADP-ribosylation factor-like protein 4A [Trichoplax sp. H2]